jgi:molecular chaperone GrpE (heat shock protein)
MTNNLPEEEKVEDAQPETFAAPESSSQVDVQSVEAEENTSPGAQPEQVEAGSQVTALLASLSDQLKETNRISRERETVIDKLHQENQRLKQGELQQALLPILRDLIRLYDDLNITAVKYADPAAAAGGEKYVNDLYCYRETVADILYRHGVEKIEVTPGEDFNSKEHKAVAAAPVAEQEQDRKISRVVRDGFRIETKIIRSVEVEVLRYKTPEVAAATPDTSVPEEGGEVQPEAK